MSLGWTTQCSLQSPRGIIHLAIYITSPRNNIGTLLHGIQGSQQPTAVVALTYFGVQVLQKLRRLRLILRPHRQLQLLLVVRQHCPVVHRTIRQQSRQSHSNKYVIIHDSWVSPTSPKEEIRTNTISWFQNACSVSSL